MLSRIVDLRLDAPELIEQAAVLLLDAFRNRTEDWQDLGSTRQEVLASLAPDRISRVAVDASGTVLGWIGGIAMYRGRVWEIHPLVVAESHRRQGIATALVRDLECLVQGRGALTLWLGSDDENGETLSKRPGRRASVVSSWRCSVPIVSGSRSTRSAASFKRASSDRLGCSMAQSTISFAWGYYSTRTQPLATCGGRCDYELASETHVVRRADEIERLAAEIGAVDWVAMRPLTVDTSSKGAPPRVLWRAGTSSTRERRHAQWDIFQVLAHRHRTSSKEDL
jgi:GNAT superfamily N-acetyltransferase